MCNKKERKETGGGICFQFPPSGRCILLFMAGRGGFVFFRGGTGRVVVFFRGGTGRFFFFFRGGTGWLFFLFFDGMGGGGVFWFFSRAGTGRLFLAVAIFLVGRSKIVTPFRQRRFKPSRQPSM